MAAPRDLLKRWTNTRRVLILLAELVLAVAAYLFHPIAGVVVLALSILSIGGRTWLDSQDARKTESGYEVQESYLWITFKDPDAHLVQMRKKQVLRAFRSGIRHMTDSHVRSDGKIQNPASKPGRVIDTKPVGVGFRYTSDLERELPVGETFDREFTIEFVDSYPNKRESHIVHVSRPVRKMEVVFQFHVDRLPASPLKVSQLDGEADIDLAHMLKDEDGDRRRWRFTAIRPRKGIEVLFEWDW